MVSLVARNSGWRTESNGRLVQAKESDLPMKSILPAVLIALVVGLAWYSYNAQKERAAGEQEIQTLRDQVAALETQVSDLKQEIENLEKGTVKGVVEEANSTLKNSLKNMLEAAEQEFERLQKSLDETFDEWQQEEEAPQDPAKDDADKQFHAT